VLYLLSYVSQECFLSLAWLAEELLRGGGEWRRREERRRGGEGRRGERTHDGVHSHSIWVEAMASEA
jgi:hypothetical protein